MSEFETIRALIHRARLEPHLLDEVDARATAYLRGRPYHRHDREPGTGAVRVWTGSGEPTICPPFQTSRDALQAEHPPGWWFRELCRGRYSGVRLDREEKEETIDRSVVLADLCATVALSELMCIMMAWEIERAIGYPEDLDMNDTGRFPFTVALYQDEMAILTMLAKRAGARPEHLVQQMIVWALRDAALVEPPVQPAGEVLDRLDA